MKTTKKVFALLLVLMLMLALGVTAFAAGEGSITISGTTDGQVYHAYKIFDLTYAGAEGAENAAYTIDVDWKPFFNSTDGSIYILDENTEPALSPITTDDDPPVTKYINITDDNVAEFARAALAYVLKNGINYDKMQTATGTTAQMTGLDLGYYLVYPYGASEIGATYASICSLTSTVPSGTVNVKAEYPKIEKTVDDPNVDIGQTVTYTINGEVPDTTGYTSYTYTVADELSAGLTFNKDVAVTIGGIDVTPDDLSYTTPDKSFTVTFDMLKYQENIGDPIVITYSAVVNAGAVIGPNGNKNSATLTYSNDPGDEESTAETPPEEKYVYTASIEIIKFDAAQDTDFLEGAQFVLQDDGDNYYKFTAAAGTTPEHVEWITSQDTATVVTTDADGKAYFRGLEAGAYKLVEIEAPDGYNLLTEPVPINLSTNQDAPLMHVIEVGNNAGSVLPTTGGVGTTIFYIVGGLLVTGAVVLLVTKKRMSANED